MIVATFALNRLDYNRRNGTVPIMVIVRFLFNLLIDLTMK
jgi:hypothetical protein